MGMPCEVNSILKLTPSQGYPATLEVGPYYQGKKSDYRIIPMDVPIPLVDENWSARADAIIRKLTWEKGETIILFEIDRIYENTFWVKEKNSKISYNSLQEPVTA
ncbi:MAG: DUF2584 family protein [Actinomycetota bacterium]